MIYARRLTTISVLFCFLCSGIPASSAPLGDAVKNSFELFCTGLSVSDDALFGGLPSSNEQVSAYVDYSLGRVNKLKEQLCTQYSDEQAQKVIIYLAAAKGPLLLLERLPVLAQKHAITNIDAALQRVIRYEKEIFSDHMFFAACPRDTILADKFVHAGAHLSPEKRNRFFQLTELIEQERKKFLRTLSFTNTPLIFSCEELAGVPAATIACCKTVDDGRKEIAVGQCLTVVATCHNAATRRAVYTAYENRGYPENKEVLHRYLVLRHEKAKLLGFESPAHEDLFGRITGSYEQASQLVNDLFTQLKPSSDAAIRQLIERLPDSVVLQDGKLLPSDVAYVKQVYSKKHFFVDHTELSDYFSLEGVFPRMCSLYEKMLNISLTVTPVSSDLCGDKNILRITARDKDTHTLYGSILFAPYANDWQFRLHTVLGARGLSFVNGDLVRPESDGADKLLTLYEASRLFHGLGLGLVHMLAPHAHQDVRKVCGLIFEELFYTKNTLRLLGWHYRTGDQMPEELVNNFLAYDHFRMITRVAHYHAQYISASLDFCGPDLLGDRDERWHNLLTSIVPHEVIMPEVFRYTSFDCLVKDFYHNVLWSQCVSAQLFSQAETSDFYSASIWQPLLSDVVGARTLPAAQKALKKLLGGELSVRYFVRSLVS